MRPKTTSSDVIQFRLPIELWTILMDLAAAKGETPTAYVKRNIEAALRAHVAAGSPDKSRKVAPVPATPVPTQRPTRSKLVDSRIVEPRWKSPLPKPR